MKLALLGSQALAYHLSGKIDRQPLDIDLLAGFDDAMDVIRSFEGIKGHRPINEGKTWVARLASDRMLEIELAWEDSVSADLLKLIEFDTQTQIKPLREIVSVSEFGPISYELTVMVPSLNVLCMLKQTHKYKKNSPHFIKTMNDIILMEENGAVIEEAHKEFFKKREKETYNYKHPNLNVNKANFFKDDNVPYTYDHDWLHTVVAVGNKPAYTNYLKPGEQVMCSKELFDSLPEEIKLNGVLEEAYVLALERSQIPNLLQGKELPRRVSFDIALMKVCTSITSGWFREYAYNNFRKVNALYSDTYMDKFLAAYHSGNTVAFTGEKY